MRTARTPQVIGTAKLLGLLPLVMLTGCQGMTGAGKGATIGAVGGGLIGNGLAKAAGGSRTAGTALGAVVGGIGGAIVGDSVDQGKRQAYAQGQAQAQAQRNAARAPTVDDVMEMSRTGVNEGLIIEQIRSTNAVYQLSNQDIIRMQQGMVPESVVREMIATGSSGPRTVSVVRPVTVVEPAPVIYQPAPSASVGFEYRSRGRR